MNLFQTNTMTLKHGDGTVVQTGLDVQKDTVNIPWNMEDQGLIPTDWFDFYSIGWTSPVPARGDYFVDENTQERFSVFGKVAPYTDHLEVRVSQVSGVTP